MSQDEDVDQAGRNWLSTLHEARVNCREQVANAMVSVPDPNRAHWPVRSRQQMAGAHEAAMEAHVSVIDYADQLMPYADEDAIEDLWEEKLGEVVVDPNDDTTLLVSLETLDNWEFAFVSNIVVSNDELRGETKQRVKRRVLLPVRSMRECYRQLNAATKSLGFAAEADADSLPRGGLKTPEPPS